MSVTFSFKAATLPHKTFKSETVKTVHKTVIEISIQRKCVGVLIFNFSTGFEKKCNSVKEIERKDLAKCHPTIKSESKTSIVIYPNEAHCFKKLTCKKKHDRLICIDT